DGSNAEFQTLHFLCRDGSSRGLSKRLGPVCYCGKSLRGTGAGPLGVARRPAPEARRACNRSCVAARSTATNRTLAIMGTTMTTQRHHAQVARRLPSGIVLSALAAAA